MRRYRARIIERKSALRDPAEYIAFFATTRSVGMFGQLVAML